MKNTMVEKSQVWSLAVRCWPKLGSSKGIAAECNPKIFLSMKIEDKCKA